MKFSQRIGKTPVRTVLQVESIDTDLKNRLWNTIIDDFFNKFYNIYSMNPDQDKAMICTIIWKEFYNLPIDEIPTYRNSTQIYIEGFIAYTRDSFFKMAWFEIYDFLEFLALMDSTVKNVGFVNECNSALEKEVSGYRIINDKVVQITSEEEIQEIEEALLTTDKWKSVQTHLKTALNFLADKKTPNYRKSISESISAVEAFCRIITSDNKATLGKALTEIEKNHKLHGALKTAFTAIYGYTSDSGGIRHSLLELDVEIVFEDAKFMLVSCSAFINYLKAKMKM